MADTRDWAGELGAKWASQIQPMDRMLEPATHFAIDALGAAAGERIIDLGCGGGPTSLEIATRVGGGGHVLGIDISPDLVDIARERSAGMETVAFELGDAASFAFEGEWDALFSRFGCMFFDAPVPALTHLRSALKPGGRAVLCVWAEPKFNPWAMVPASAATEVLGPAEKVPPGAPGPFGWATPDIFMPILEDAGWTGIAVAEHDLRLPISAGEDPDPVERAITHACRIGPLARRLEDHPDAEIEIRKILVETLRPLVEGDVVMIGARIRIISARA